MHIVKIKGMGVHRLISILFVTCIISLLSGCTAEYNLEISKNKIEENITILEDIKTLNGSNPNSKLNGIIASNDVRGESLYNYEIKRYIDDEQYGLKLKLDKYELSTFKTCFSNVEITTSNDEYVLNGNDGFNCLNIWDKNYNVKVNIKVHGTIVDSNADLVNKNIATWDIDDENDSIYLRYKLNSTNNKGTIVAIIIITTVLLVITIGAFYMYAKHKKNNEI